MPPSSVPTATAAPTGITTIVFDIDGTLLDSATGILAGFRRALAEGGVAAPDAAELRTHLGPPLSDFLVSAGVPPERVDRAAQAARQSYASASGGHSAAAASAAAAAAAAAASASPTGSAGAADSSADDTRKYCICQQPSYGDMVGCDNDTCPYEWFHFSWSVGQTQRCGHVRSAESETAHVRTLTRLLRTRGGDAHWHSVID